MIYDEDPPSAHGPYQNPVDRFAHLSPVARKWLQGLDEEDILELIEMQQGYRRAKTVGWFLKWIFFLSVSVFTGAVAFGEYVARAWRLVKGQ